MMNLFYDRQPQGPANSGFSQPAGRQPDAQNPIFQPLDTPEMQGMQFLCNLHPQDKDLHEYATFLTQYQMLQMPMMPEDPFIQNYPPKNSVLTNESAISVGQMPTQDTMPFPLSRVSNGTIIAGLPGSGKTNLAKFMVTQLVLSGVLVIVWDIKGTWKNLIQVPELQDRTIFLNPSDFKWSLLQPPPKTDLHEWANQITNLIAQAYERISAQRMLREIIDDLLKYFQGAVYPTLDMLVQQLSSIKTKNYRDKDYASSVLWVLKDLSTHFPGCFEYICSDFAERLFSQPGRLIIIEKHGLTLQHWNFLICLLEEYGFTYRRNSPCNKTFDVLHVLEDSTSLIDPGRDRSTPGGVSLIAQNLNLSREMRIGKLIICHSLQQVSQKVMHNIDSFFVCSLRGDDLRLAMQVLGISRDQAEFMRTNPRGTACALVPSVWPHPVLVNVPYIGEGL